MAVVILQRCVPRYREALFAALHERHGWIVVAARNFPGGTHLDLVGDGAAFLRCYDYRFPDPANAYRCRVPTSAILRDLRPDAVIAELSLSMSSTRGLLLRRYLAGGPPVYFWSHGWNMPRGLSGAGRVLQLPRLALARLADGHVVYSEEGRRFLARHVDPARIRVVRNTLALTDPPRMARPAARQPGGPRLLSIGRLTPDKDFPGLLRAFRRLAVDFPDARLTLIGDGPDAARVRAEAAGLLDRSVVLTGALHDERELAPHFRAADLAVFHGAVGLSVNHALLHGVPVVAFDRLPGGPNHNPEIAWVVDGVTGLRVKRHSDAAMAETLRELLRRHPDPRRAFAASIAKFVDENLTLETMLRDFDGVREMLAGHGVAAGDPP